MINLLEDTRTRIHPSVLLYMDASGNEYAVKRFRVRDVADFQRLSFLNWLMDNPHENLLVPVDIRETGDLVEEVYPFIYSDSNASSRLSIQQVLGIARGVAHIHNAGFIHHDVKGRNIFINHRHNLVRLFDYSETRRPYDVCVDGLFTFPSPEYHVGASITPAYDVYDLGLMLGESLNHHPVSSEINDLRLIALKASSSDPRNRFIDACEMVEEIERARERAVA